MRIIVCHPKNQLNKTRAMRGVDHPLEGDGKTMLCSAIACGEINLIENVSRLGYYMIFYDR